MSYLIVDVVLVALLLLAVWRGYRRGFVLTLCGFLAVFVAIAGASYLSNLLAQPVSRVIQPAIEQHVQQLFDEKLGQTDLGEDLTQTQLAIPFEQALELLQQSQLYQGFVSAFKQAVDAGVAQTTGSVVRSFSEYLALQIARVALYILCFILILIVWFLLSHALNLAFKLPVLSTLNRWSGAALAIGQWGVILFVAAWLCKGFLDPAQVESTYVLNFFVNTDPFSLLSKMTIV
jgi:uncharacterized membrane protein required for colicin V production